MASGIMLNTAPRLLSPSTGVSNTLWSAQERDGGRSMKMSLQLHKCVSQTPSLSASPLPPSPLFKKFLFDTLLKCSLISCSSFIMHVHFKFAWIYFPDASAANLTYNDVYCTVSTIVLWFNQGDSLHLWLYFSIYTLVIRGDGGEAGVKCFPQRGAFIAPQWCWGEEELSDVDGTASGTDWLMLNSQQCLMHCLQHRKKHQKQLAFKNALNQHVTHKKKKVWHL